MICYSDRQVEEIRTHFVSSGGNETDWSQVVGLLSFAITAAVPSGIRLDAKSRKALPKNFQTLEKRLCKLHRALTNKDTAGAQRWKKLVQIKLREYQRSDEYDLDDPYTVLGLIDDVQDGRTSIDINCLAARFEETKERPMTTWLTMLAEIWETSGLAIKTTGAFPEFVKRCWTLELEQEFGNALTDTTVRDFVDKTWRQ